MHLSDFTKRFHGRKSRQTQSNVEDAPTTTSTTSSQGGHEELYSSSCETRAPAQNAPPTGLGPLDPIPITVDLAARPRGLPTSKHAPFASAVSTGPLGSQAVQSSATSSDYPADPLGGRTVPHAFIANEYSTGLPIAQARNNPIFPNDHSAGPLCGQAGNSINCNDNHFGGPRSNQAAPNPTVPKEHNGSLSSNQTIPYNAHAKDEAAHSLGSQIPSGAICHQDRSAGPLGGQAAPGDLHVSSLPAGPLGNQALPDTNRTLVGATVPTLKRSQETVYEDAQEHPSLDCPTSTSPHQSQRSAMPSQGFQRLDTVTAPSKQEHRPKQPMLKERGHDSPAHVTTQDARTTMDLAGHSKKTLQDDRTLDSVPLVEKKIAKAEPTPPPPVALMDPKVAVIAGSHNIPTTASTCSTSVSRHVDVTVRASSASPLPDQSNAALQQPAGAHAPRPMVTPVNLRNGPAAMIPSQGNRNEDVAKTRSMNSDGQASSGVHSPTATHPEDIHDPHTRSPWAAEKAFAASPASRSTPMPIPKSNLHMGLGDSTPPLADHGDTKRLSLTDVMRYRQDFGVNLGGCFVLEKWLFGSAFPPEAPEGRTSELSAATLWFKHLGVDGARQKFEHRWAEVLNDDDWRWLSTVAKITSLRLPIGYFTLGPKFCKNTPFEHYSGIYVNAWNAVKKLIAKARSHGISVLVDLHALPGGQNTADHAGTNMAKAEFWAHPSNLDLGTCCIKFLVAELRDVDNIRGIQICNEPSWHASGVYDWYTSVLIESARIDATMPIYISDGWDLATAVNWIKTKNTVVPGQVIVTNPVVADTHQYFCFDKADKLLPPDAIIQKLHSSLAAIEHHKGSLFSRGASAAIVGEWCVRLDEASWSLHPEGVGKRTTKRSFGTAQCDQHEKMTGGSYFWTLKMDWLPGGDWGFLQQIQDRRVAAPKYVALDAEFVRQRLAEVDAQANHQGTKTYDAHAQYWYRTAPGKKMRPDLYKIGWHTGWSDARSFFSARTDGLVPGSTSGGDKIGFKELWMRKRISETKVLNDEFLWEFAHGMHAGMHDFEHIAFA